MQSTWAVVEVCTTSAATYSGDLFVITALLTYLALHALKPYEFLVFFVWGRLRFWWDLFWAHAYACALFSLFLIVQNSGPLMCVLGFVATTYFVSHLVSSFHALWSDNKRHRCRAILLDFLVVVNLLALEILGAQEVRRREFGLGARSRDLRVLAVSSGKVVQEVMSVVFVWGAEWATGGANGLGGWGLLLDGCRWNY